MERLNREMWCLLEIIYKDRQFRDHRRKHKRTAAAYLQSHEDCGTSPLSLLFSLFCVPFFAQRAELPFTIISQQVLCTTWATEEHDFLKQASIVFFCNSNLMHNMLNTSVIQNRLLNRSVLISLFVCFQGPTSVCFDTQERRGHPSPHINNRLMISAQGSSDMWGSSTQDSRRWDVSHQHKSSF